MSRTLSKPTLPITATLRPFSALDRSSHLLPLRRKSFNYRKCALFTFSKSLIYRLRTFSHLCKSLIARVGTTSHVNQNFFPQASFAPFPPAKTFGTEREVHASGMLTSGSPATCAEALKTLLYLSVPRKFKFFRQPAQSTLVPSCLTFQNTLRHCHFLFCGYGSLWLTKDGGL